MSLIRKQKTVAVEYTCIKQCDICSKELQDGEVAWCSSNWAKSKDILASDSYMSTGNMLSFKFLCKDCVEKVPAEVRELLGSTETVDSKKHRAANTIYDIYHGRFDDEEKNREAFITHFAAGVWVFWGGGEDDRYRVKHFVDLVEAGEDVLDQIFDSRSHAIDPIPDAVMVSGKIMKFKLALQLVAGD